MGKFWGRIEELKTLRREHSKKRSGLVVIYGRRRVGKSSLIKEFGRGQNFLCFDGLENENSRVQIEHFRKQLASQIQDPDLDDMTWSSWDRAFDYLTRHIATKKEKTIVFLDEFQWMSCQQSRLTALIKSYWDNHWKDSGQMLLVLCGSISSFMVGKVIHSKALYGRIHLELQVRPMPFQDALLFFQSKRGLAESLKYYLLFGGVPKYLEAIDLKCSFEQNIQSLCFDRTGEFFGEYEKIFHSQFREPSTYEKIISFLSEGPKSYTEIIEHLSMRDGGGAKSYISNLELAGFVAVQASPLKKAKIKKYYIDDEYLRFYLKYVRTEKKKIKSGQSTDLFKKNVQSSWQAWLGLCFEHFCVKNANLLATIMGFASDYEDAGAFLVKGNDSRFGVQVDLVYDRKSIVTLVEVKFHERLIDAGVVDEVQSKVIKIQEIVGPYRTIETALVAPFGVSSSLLKTKYFHHIITLKDLATKAGG